MKAEYTFNYFFTAPSFAVVQIGFNNSVYTIDERAGEVVVSVVVLSGTLSDEVVVRFNTQDSSALGRFRNVIELISFIGGML